jgi:hypothetical protein
MADYKSRIRYCNFYHTCYHESLLFIGIRQRFKIKCLVAPFMGNGNFIRYNKTLLL